MVFTQTLTKLTFVMNKHVIHFNLATLLFSIAVLNEMPKGKLHDEEESSLGINKIIYHLKQKKKKKAQFK